MIRFLLFFHLIYGCKLESQFIVIKSPKKWNDAESECIKLGGHLASILNKNESSEVDALIMPGEKYWLGLRSKNVGKKFEWSDLQPLTYSRFGNETLNNFWGD